MRFLGLAVQVSVNISARKWDGGLSAQGLACALGRFFAGRKALLVRFLASLCKFLQKYLLSRGLGSVGALWTVGVLGCFLAYCKARFLRLGSKFLRKYLFACGLGEFCTGHGVRASLLFPTKIHFLRAS